MLEQHLTDMLRDRPDALGSRQVFLGLLMDYFPQERITVQVLILLYDMGIHTEIASAGRVTRDFAYRFAKRLMDERGIEGRHAESAANLFCVCYAEVLGKPCDPLVTSAPLANTGALVPTPTQQNIHSAPQASQLTAPVATKNATSMRFFIYAVSLALLAVCGALAWVTLSRLPSGESIMDRATEVTGGLYAHKNIKSMVSKGTFEFEAEGLELVLSGLATAYQASPNLKLVEMDYAGIGKFLSGCNGANAWEYNTQTGLTFKSGREAEEAMEDAMFSNYWRDLYTGAQTKGVETVEGETCYAVELTRKDRSPITTYYSKRTGLKVARRFDSDTYAYKDYRWTAGFLMPFKVVTPTGSVTYTEIEFNADIPKSKFDPPKVRAAKR